MWGDDNKSTVKMTPIDYKAVPLAKFVTDIKNFKGFSEWFKGKPGLNLESPIFYLHSVVTVFILFLGTVFLTMNQYFGSPIKCLTTNEKGVDMALIHHYCWMEGIFSLPRLPMQKPYQHHAYPGVRPFEHPIDYEKPVYHRYYQWVYFVLIVQSVLFYFPRRLWKKSKSRKIRDLLDDLEKKHFLEYPECDQLYFLQEISDLVETGASYFSVYMALEIFYFVHIVAEIWFTNVFLGGSFLTLGYDWLFIDNADAYNPNKDPLIHTFPRLAKCLFHTYGLTAGIEAKDMLCFLPLNIVNEKLFIVLWFWYFVLFWFTLVVVASRLFYVFPCYRYFRLKITAPKTHKKHLRKITNRLGSFFIMSLIAKNLRPSNFAYIVDELVSNSLADDKQRLSFTNRYKEILIANTGTQPTAPLLSSIKKDKKSKKDKKPPAIGFAVGETSTSNKDDWNSGGGDDYKTSDNNYDDWNTANDNNDNWDDKDKNDGYGNETSNNEISWDDAR